MSLFKLDIIDNEKVINLCNFNKEEHTKIVIPYYINEITITSEGETTNTSIYVDKRREDLVIKLKNAIINSGDEIGIDFRCGKENNYTNYIEFYGKNFISSKDNIGILISCNKKVKIIGNEDGELRISSQNEGPALGNNIYSCGGGEIYFEGSGKIYLRCYNFGNAIGFDNIKCKTVNIGLNDNVYLCAIGGNGCNINSSKGDLKAGNGGCGIYVSGNANIEKYGNTDVEIEGGCGGFNEKIFGGGNCGDGGAAISIGSGRIYIKKYAKLKGGNGGNFNITDSDVISKGGNGGDCILITNTKDKLEMSEIKIDNDIIGEGGNGGNSKIHINSEGKFESMSGGNGGNFINATTTYSNIILGNIEYKEGLGGKCICDDTLEDGKNGMLVIGDNTNIEYNKNAFSKRVEIYPEDLIVIKSDENSIVRADKGNNIRKQDIVNYLWNKIRFFFTKRK